MLGFGRSPRVMHLEAFVAVAGLAVHAALGGFLNGRFTHVTHDGHGRAGCLTVAFYDALQREVTEEHADPSLPKIDVMLAPGTGEGGDSRRNGGTPPSGRRDGSCFIKT